MARKRRIVVQTPQTEEMGEEEQGDLDWTTWFKKDFLRYWYAVGCLFLDAVISLEIYLQPDRPLTLALFTLIALIGVEGFVYLKIWHREKREI